MNTVEWRMLLRGFALFFFTVAGLLPVSEALADLPQAGWTLLGVDSEELVGEDGRAVNAFDGDTTTIWHTSWSGSSDPRPPHEIAINLNGTYSLTGFRYLPRQDGTLKGNIRDYAFYVSSDGVNWGTSVAAGRFAANSPEKEVTFAPVLGGYVKLVALNEVYNRAWTVAAEINLLGGAASDENLAPTAADDNYGIAAGSTNNLLAVLINDSDPNSGDTITLVSTSTPDQGGTATVVGNTVSYTPTPGFVGVERFDYIVEDTGGLTAVATITVTVSAVVGVIPQVAWTLLGVDSEELTGEDGRAVNAFDGDTTTIWHTSWSGSSDPPPPHEIVINLNGTYNLSGFRYLPRQDGNANGNIRDYAFYVGNDGVSWGTAVAAGTFASPSSSTKKEITFAPVLGGYVKLVALNEVNGRAWTSAAEINLLGSAATGENLAPTAVDDSYGIAAGSSDSLLAVLTNDSDPNPGDTLTLVSTGTPDQGGTATVVGNTVSYTPAPGFVGVERFDYALEDSGGLPATATVTVTVNAVTGVIPQSGWTLHDVDSEETVGEDGRAVNAFDGNTDSLWHTRWYGSGDPPPPHEIAINLNGIYNLSGFRYLPRQDGNANGNIRDYEFYVSTDGVSWGTAVAAGTFASPSSSTEKEVTFAPVLGGYVRLVALNEVNGRAWTSAAEISLLQSDCLTPRLLLMSPRQDDVQPLPDITARATLCKVASDLEAYGVKFLLDGGNAAGGAEIWDTSPPFEAVFSSVTTTNHTVAAQLVDSSGASVSGSQIIQEVSNVGSGTCYVAHGDSITSGYGDDMAGDDTSLDGRTTGGGWPPVLNDNLTAVVGYPHNVVNEGVPGDTSVQGLVRIADVIARHSDCPNFLLLFGTNDANPNQLFPVPSGFGLSPGDAGYAGSYKANMQGMIDGIVGAGGSAYLAKIPYTLETGGRNANIVEYNQVVDELVTENSISVTPPDLYSYFQSNQDKFSDTLHPNGQGYRSVADLWANALP